jgi:hypothetical protein
MSKEQFLQLTRKVQSQDSNGCASRPKGEAHRTETATHQDDGARQKWSVYANTNIDRAAMTQ